MVRLMSASLWMDEFAGEDDTLAHIEPELSLQ
jgi:hypothetical protein